MVVAIGFIGTVVGIHGWSSSIAHDVALESAEKAVEAKAGFVQSQMMELALEIRHRVDKIRESTLATSNLISEQAAAAGELDKKIKEITQQAKKISNDDIAKANELLKSFSKSGIKSNGNYLQVGDVVVCWGSSKLKVPETNKHTRRFSFEFPVEFDKPPVVSNGINTDGSGYNYNIYRHSLSNSEYSGSIVTTHGLPERGERVTFNYIAVGTVSAARTDN